MELKKNIKDYHENLMAQLLIEAHSGGAGMRDEQDFNQLKFHIHTTLLFAKDLILNIEGTDKEKGEFIDKISTDLEKFEINHS